MKEYDEPIYNEIKDVVESFERVSKIKEIILLGMEGEIRRIIIDEN